MYNILCKPILVLQILQKMSCQLKKGKIIIKLYSITIYIFIIYENYMSFKINFLFKILTLNLYSFKFLRAYLT